jgi:ferric-dicitrate binding protein FerR (iron transport regulator)
MDMDCKSSTDLMARRLSGNASLDDDAQLRGHLESCRVCAEAERGLARTWALMGQLQPLVSTSRVPVLAAPTPLFRNPQWMVGAAAAAVLIASAVAFGLRKPATPPAPEPAPVAAQIPAEESHPEQRREEVRVQEVLTRIENEKPAPEQPLPEKPAPVNPEPQPVAVPERPAPRPTETPAPEPKVVVVQTPAAQTRPEEKSSPAVKPAAAPVSPGIATLDRVEGDVWVVASGNRAPARSGLTLASGDALETVGKASQAVVEFPDGTRLVLGADTIVDSIRIADGKRVSLKQGVLAAQVSRQPAGELMTFVTASAEARVLGTRLTLSVTSFSTRLEVREGKVRVARKDDGASIDVPADHFIVVGKGISMTPKPATSARIVLRETFDRPRWGGAWLQGGDTSLGIRLAIESGSLSVKTLQKPPQEVSAGKMPSAAAEAARKEVQGAGGIASLSRKEWPRAGWLETRQSFPFSNETPLKIRIRTWNSHNDPDRLSWLSLNRGVSGQGLSLERRGGTLQLWVEGAAAPVWKKDAPSVQEWETLELWLSKDQMLVRRNDETLYNGANPLRIKAGALSLGVNAKMELAQDEEVRFDHVDVILTTRAELEEVAR